MNIISTFSYMPNISKYPCIEPLIRKTTELADNTDIEYRITKIGLLALSEIAAIIEFGNQLIYLGVGILNDFYQFQFPSIDKITDFFNRTLELNCFFFGLIPYLISYNLNLTSLNMILNLQDQEIEGMNHSNDVTFFKILNNYSKYLDPNLTLFEKLEVDDHDIPNAIRKIESILLWTKKDNQLCLLLCPLNEQQQNQSDEIYSYFRTILSLYRAFHKIYPDQTIKALNQMIKGDLLEFEQVMELSPQTNRLHKEIFFVFKKLLYFINKISIEELIHYYYKKFDEYLFENYEAVLVAPLKHILLNKDAMETHFSSISSDPRFIDLSLNQLEGLKRKNCPYANQANECMQKSFKSYLKQSEKLIKEESL